MDFQNKTVLVTGGGRGLGRAYCEALSKAGASVVVADIRETQDTVETIISRGGKAIGLSLDVTDMLSCQNMADRAIKEYGNINCLVNNAALYGDISGGRFDQLKDDQWDNVMAVNVKGIWQCCKACVPYLRKSGGGSIIIFGGHFWYALCT